MMANNLDLSPDAQLAFALADLRGLAFSGRVGSGQHLAPGICFSLDPEASNTVDVTSTPGEMMTARLGVDRPGRWLTLNLGIGTADLSGCSIIGFACKSDAAATTTSRVCLRRGVEGGHRDAFFAKTLVSYPKTALHLDVLDLAANPELVAPAPWRELVIFFEIASAEICLRDFRFFAI